MALQGLLLVGLIVLVQAFSWIEIANATPTRFSRSNFPDSFVFGTASSASQVFFLVFFLFLGLQVI